jgi:hypothetical protein
MCAYQAHIVMRQTVGEVLRLGRREECEAQDGARHRLLNIRLSSKDLEAIQKRALAEGLPIRRRFRACCTGARRGGSKRSEPADDALDVQFQPTFNPDAGEPAYQRRMQSLKRPL